MIVQGANYRMAAKNLGPAATTGIDPMDTDNGTLISIKAARRPEVKAMLKVSLYPLNADSDYGIVVDKNAFVIGRGFGCDLKVNNLLISRRHCILEVTDDAVFVRDLESSNGTAINGGVVRGRRRLHDRDQLWLATTPFEIRIRSLTKIGSGINLLSQAVARAWFRTVEAGSPRKTPGPQA